MVNRKGLLGVLVLCGVACGEGGATDDGEPTATGALLTQADPDVALVEPGDDLSSQWGDWNGWGSRPSTSTAPSGGAWDSASVARWCFLLEDRQAEFLCKVTFADCQNPRDTFTQILCQLRGMGSTPSTPSGGNNPNPPRGGNPDAWGDDLVDVDGDNDAGGAAEDDDDDDWGGSSDEDVGDEDWNTPGEPGLGG